MIQEQKNLSRLSKRITDFFEANPEEDMTATDFAHKFITARSNVSMSLNSLERTGVLVKHKEGRIVIYSKAGTQ